LSPLPRARKGVLLTALVAAAGLVSSGPAHAAERLVHQTPPIPLVVDGKHYAPAQIHRFDGHALYMRTDGKRLIAYTKLDRFKRFLRSRGLYLPTPADVTHPKARASFFGGWADICLNPYLNGDCRRIQSGWGAAAMAALDDPTCQLGTCTHYDNNVSSIHTYRVAALLFDYVGFNYAGLPWYDSDPGDVYLVEPDKVLASDGHPPLVGLPAFDNRTSSMYVYW
jgi:hypothetical protein